MAFKGVTFEQGKVGANVSGAAAGISGLIVSGVAVAGKLELAKHYTLNSVDDLEALGIDEAYDTANSVLVYHHVREFYRMSGSGKELNLMVVAQEILPGDMLDDPTSTYARKLITSAEGRIRLLAVAFNPAADYEELVTDGFNADIRAAIPKAQALADWAFDTDRPLNVLLEGRAYSGNAATAISLKALEVSEGVALEAENVSVVIAQDYDFADTLWAAGKKYASVGLLLGTLAGININQSIGDVEPLNLSDAAKGIFITGGLSSHTPVKDAEASLSTLGDKGYILAGLYTGQSGYRWDWAHVCAPEKIDSENRINLSTIEYGRTFNEACRNLRDALLPKIKSTQPVDPETGKLPIAIIRHFEALGDGVFGRMESAGLISAGQTRVDPDSDLLNGERVLKFAFAVVPTGTIREIVGIINLKSKF